MPPKKNSIMFSAPFKSTNYLQRLNAIQSKITSEDKVRKKELKQQTTVGSVFKPPNTSKERVKQIWNIYEPNQIFNQRRPNTFQPV